MLLRGNLHNLIIHNSRINLHIEFISFISTEVNKYLERYFQYCSENIAMNLHIKIISTFLYHI